MSFFMGCIRPDLDDLGRELVLTTTKIHSVESINVYINSGYKLYNITEAKA